MKKSQQVVVGAVAVALLSACQGRPTPERPDTKSTAELLKWCGAAIDSGVLFVGEPFVVEALSEYRFDRGAREERIRLAEALLRVGRTPEAVSLYDELLQEGPAGSTPEEFVDQVEFPRAIAYLRLGEQENCVEHNAAESCLFPIGERGVHAEPRRSTIAVEALTSIIERDPANITAQWLAGNGISGGAIFEDFDGDDYRDIMASAVYLVG